MHHQYLNVTSHQNQQCYIKMKFHMRHLLLICHYFFVGIPFHIYFLKRLMTVSKTDKRVNIMNEIISSMQVTKMYAWEESFSALINEARK